MYSVVKTVAVIGLATCLAAGCSQDSSSNSGGDSGMTAESAPEMHHQDGHSGMSAPDMAAEKPADHAGDGNTSDAATAVGAVTVATTKQEPYGVYLVDAAGKSLYLFKADAQGEGSTCYDACAEIWPPLLTVGKPDASGQARADLLGTIERKNGATQVTYNGWPLYYFAQDNEPGDTQGQDVHGFGAEWYLVAPDGTVVHAE